MRGAITQPYGLVFMQIAYNILNHPSPTSPTLTVRDLAHYKFPLKLHGTDIDILRAVNAVRRHSLSVRAKGTSIMIYSPKRG